MNDPATQLKELVDWLEGHLSDLGPCLLDESLDHQLVAARAVLKEHEPGPEEKLAHYLKGKYDHWGEHPHLLLSRSEWQLEASNNDTSLGYWLWVANQIINYLEDEDYYMVPEDEQEIA